ncbi:MAG: head GIN domain-containing protein [Bacteroidia bacterium]
MTKYSLLSIFAFALLTSGCYFMGPKPCEKGKGGIETGSFGLSNFDEVQLDLDAEVVLHQDSTYKIEVEAQPNILDLIDVRKVGSRLQLRTDACFSGSPVIKIHVFMPQVKAIELNSSGSILSANKFVNNDMGSNLDIKINGSGDVQFQGDAGAIRNTISGSGDVILEGSAESVETTINASGDFNWKNGKADDYKVRINGSGGVYSFESDVKDADLGITGSGNIEVRLNGELNVNIAGSGSVYYKGQPTGFNANITGSGKVVNKN